MLGESDRKILTDAITAIRLVERRRIVGKILETYGEAITRGDKLTAEVLDALATRAEHEP